LSCPTSSFTTGSGVLTIRMPTDAPAMMTNSAGWLRRRRLPPSHR
jgi:hypothetical protein